MANKLLKYNDQYLSEQRTYIYDGKNPPVDFFAINSFDFKGNSEKKCIEVTKLDDGGITIETIYFIGVDWLTNEQPIYIEPKLNDKAANTNYLQMLISALQHPELAEHTSKLYDINFEKETIAIEQEQDLLTPLLVIHFLSIVKEIVRKGLKKSYYKVENNLFGRIKGKVMVGQTIKQNHFKNKPLNTYCNYDEFGLNGLENRLLKKALVFVQRYLQSIKNLEAGKYAEQTFGYIMPAFDFISDEANINDIKHTKTNAFYKEYKDALHLAKLILKRFGYNINNTQEDTIQTPPFWIDMSKLFELYVLGLLKDRFGDKVSYHDYIKGNELDYLLNCTENGKVYKMVIDAKYKKKYKNSGMAGYDIEDIRQVSGYARLKKVQKHLFDDLEANKLVDCLIIYPNQEIKRDTLIGEDLFRQQLEPNDFAGFFKISVSLPVIGKE